MTDGWLWAGALGMLGAIFGSYIATVAIRWPEPATGRSRCDACGNPLRPWHLIPLAGFVLLGGRCRYCRERIAPAHGVIEALGLGIGVAVGALAPGLTGAVGAIFGWLLLALAAIDVVAYRLPHPLTTTLGVAGLVAGAAGVMPPLVDRAIGGVAGFGVLWLVAAGYRQLRGRDGLGGGDARMLGAIGLWIGWRGLAPTVLVACLIGLAWAISRGLRRDDRLPFGALLAPAAFAIWLWSVAIGCDSLMPCLISPRP